MIMTKEQIKDFENAARPLIKYLAENHHPHVTAIVDGGRCEILESSAFIPIDDYIVD